VPASSRCPFFFRLVTPFFPVGAEQASPFVPLQFFPSSPGFFFKIVGWYMCLCNGRPSFISLWKMEFSPPFCWMHFGSSGPRFFSAGPLPDAGNPDLSLMHVFFLPGPFVIHPPPPQLSVGPDEFLLPLVFLRERLSQSWPALAFFLRLSAFFFPNTLSHLPSSSFLYQLR